MPPFVLILAIFPFSLNPSFFPPLPSARQQFIYIIVYADSFLPPRRTHTDFSCWCFPPFFRRFFLVMIIYCPLPPLLSVSAPQNTPFLGFFRSISFSCTHISPPRFSLHWRLIFFWWCFLSPDNTDRISPLSPPAAVPGAAAVGCRSRSFSRLSPPVSDGLSAQTKWRLVVSTPLIRGEGWRYSNIRREGEEGGREEGKKRGGCLRRCSGLSGNRFRALQAVADVNL